MFMVQFSNMTTESVTRWYQKKPVIIVFLVFFFPLGLFLMWKYADWNKRTKLIITGFFAFLLIIGRSSGSPRQEQLTVQPNPVVQTTPVEKVNVVVTSQIVKKVEGKYRYFFDIRNNDKTPFEGSVSITLYNDLSDNSLAGETFKTNRAIESGLGTSQYADANTGPTSVHGSNGISKFKYKVKKGDAEVNQGEGQITDKFEDTSN